MEAKIHLYRNHTPECRALLAQQYRKMPTAAMRKQAIVRHRDCSVDPKCPFWYREAGKPHGVAIGTRDEGKANEFVLSLRPKNEDQTKTGPLLKDCIQEFTAETTTIFSKGTKKRYRGVFAQLQAYATIKGKIYIQELDANFYIDLKTHGMDGKKGIKDTTKKMRFASLKHFLSVAYYPHKWILEPIHVQLQHVKFADDSEETQPYTEDQAARIIELAGTLNGKSDGYGKNPRTFQLLLQLLDQTGMRISDAISFNPNKCFAGNKDGRWIYQYYAWKRIRTSKKKLIQVYLTNKLKIDIENCEWMSDALPFASCAVTEDTMESLTAEVYNRLQLIGSKLGIADCRAHRFRDTFAVRWILKGKGVEMVSKLLNHSKIQITVDYYLPWILQRQNQLQNSFFEGLQAA